MKTKRKVLLILSMFLMLSLSIVFSGCGNQYKKLKIEANVEQIELIMGQDKDGEDLSTAIIDYEISGVKAWGEVEINSSPLGHIQVKDMLIDGKHCYVQIKALQPTDEGAELVIKHLGSGKSLSLPLTIGLKLEEVESKNLEYVVDIPASGDDGEERFKDIVLDPKTVLNTTPFNYSDKIIWINSDQNESATNVKLIYYANDGTELASQGVLDVVNDAGADGQLQAVSSVLSVSSKCANGTEIELIPVSVLNQKFVKHEDAGVTVKMVDLLDETITVVSPTHQGATATDKEEEKETTKQKDIADEIVLISNPASKRKVDGQNDEYNYYNTAIINLKYNNELINSSTLENVYDIYNVNASTNIPNLLLEVVDMATIRAVATPNCVGEGNITIDFTPNNSTGDIKSFSIKVPCRVGEQATSISAKVGDETVSFNKGEVQIDGKTQNAVVGIAPLMDDYASANGQMFSFKVLGENTLTALKGYKIKIHKSLLYINPGFISGANGDKYSPYIKNADGTGGTEISSIDQYKCQISIKKDGRDVTFFASGNYFVSEPLTTYNAIYMKYVNITQEDIEKDGTGRTLIDNSSEFQIEISNFYDYKYNIYESGFEQTAISQVLKFDRQRKVESITYRPVMYTNNGAVSYIPVNGLADGWQYYLQHSEIESKQYGIQITSIKGINNTDLNPTELENINLVMQVFKRVGASNIGLGAYEDPGSATITSGQKYIFKWDEQTHNNSVFFVALDEVIELGEYYLEISQNSNILTRDEDDEPEIKINVYRPIEENDITVAIPTADYSSTQYLITEDDKSWLAGAGAGERQDIYMIATSTKNSVKQYDIEINVDDGEYISYSIENALAVMASSKDGAEDVLDNARNTYLTHNLAEQKITSGLTGLYNKSTKENNYIKIDFTFKIAQYDYYAIKADTTDITKSIYIFVYEPLTQAYFNDTQITKYDYELIKNTDYAKTEGQHTLNITLNGDDVINYVNIQWNHPEGVKAKTVSADNLSATLTFTVGNSNRITSTIIATITQYGITYPIRCGLIVEKPILSDGIVLNNSAHNFKTGGAFINISHVEGGTELQIDAKNISSKGTPTFNGLKYIICSTSGFADSSIATIDENGLLTTHKAGRVKLIVFASDRQVSSLNGIVDYFQFTRYVSGNAYLMIDVLISDGSEQYPYLITNADEFKNIKNALNKHYSLVSDINLNGTSINFGEFSGSIKSFQENANSENRFNVYGLNLSKYENNMYLFESLAEGGKIENVNFHVDIDYSIKSTGEILIGLIGTNNGTIKNISVIIDAKINLGEMQNTLYFGAIVAKNNADITIDDIALIGVEGTVVVEDALNTTAYIGGVAGANAGKITGAIKPLENDANVEYDVYYGNQGALVDIDIQVKSAKDGGLGGAVGYNTGKIENVYVVGNIVGRDDENRLQMNNVGGIVGKNEYSVHSKATITTAIDDNGYISVDKVDFAGVQKDDYQISNSYSIAKVVGKDNVGGTIGVDQGGIHKKLYYEIYDTDGERIKGNNNVGGLIGSAKNTSLNYCYISSFVLNYAQAVTSYELVGNNYVGGLIGYADSSPTNAGAVVAESTAIKIANSSANISMQSTGLASGLIGRLSGWGGMYTTYFYGVMQASTMRDVAYLYLSKTENISNKPYNNTYSLINGMLKVNDVYNADGLLADAANTNFAINSDYNNGKPYIKDENGNSLVTLVPSKITINDAFYTSGYTHVIEDEVYIVENGVYIKAVKGGEGYYVLAEAGGYVYIDDTFVEFDESNEEHKILKQYRKIDASEPKYTPYVYTSMFVQNDKLGNYVQEGNKYVLYNANNHSGQTRYLLMADIARTQDSVSNDSDYRQDVLVLYYYQFASMLGEHAFDDIRLLNTVDMHKLLRDGGIMTIPTTSKRFVITSSNNDIVSVLSNGKLLLRKEGQVTITLTSMLNKNAKASFVVFVRNKVLDFNLYSSATKVDEYLINGKEVNIVNGSSKIVFEDYSAIIDVYNRNYPCVSATNMGIEFAIENVGDALDGDISDYITINSGNDVKYGTPITISVHKYYNGQFKITAKPYVELKYVNGQHTETIKVYLNDNFIREFYVITKQGVKDINTDITYTEIMPNDDLNVDVVINTDVQVNKIQIELQAQDKDGNSSIGIDTNGNGEIDDEEVRNFYEMLDIILNSTTYNVEEQGNKFVKVIEFSSTNFDSEKELQTFSLALKLNEKAHYVNTPYTIKLFIRAYDAKDQIIEDKFGMLTIDILPQAITSLMTHSYKAEKQEGAQITHENLQISNVIRPGGMNFNVININIAPSIAIYEYLEITDIFSENENDIIHFTQLTEDYKTMSKMDEVSSDGKGIKLKKTAYNTSSLFVSAVLPLDAIANARHNIKITAYDKDSNVLKTQYIALEAILYPTVIATYTPPKGSPISADTTGTLENVDEKTIDLAIGVEAPISITTKNMDAGSLRHSLSVVNADGDELDLTHLVKLDSHSSGYTLRFVSSKQNEWDSLLGQNIKISFTVTKTLNGIKESATATLNFTVRQFVVHGVSMKHTTASASNTLYGDFSTDKDGNKPAYDGTFETEYYFATNDISYYDRNSYWDKDYTLDYTNNAQEDTALGKIKALLMAFNKLETAGVTIKFDDNTTDNVDGDELVETEYSNGEITKYSYKYTKDSKDIIKIANNEAKTKILISVHEDARNIIKNSSLEINFNIDYDNNYPIIKQTGTSVKETYRFAITDRSTPFEDYLTVYTAEDFRNMLEGKYYKLMNNITLKDYAPISTNISALTGNGNTITIENFNYTAMQQAYSNGVAYIGLFGTVQQNTVISNLQVAYSGAEIDLTTSVIGEGETYSQVYFGGVAGQNLGMITNVNITGQAKIRAPQISSNNMYMGGIAGTNGTSASTKATITNSSSSLTLEGLAMIGGISESNYGKIANTTYMGNITCAETSDYIATIYTAGFVVNNFGDIALSYVGKNDQKIDSVGNVAGFVANNTGTISNSYVLKVQLSSQGNIAGFVYDNRKTVKYAYAYADFENGRLYKKFIFQSSGAGMLIDCYTVGKQDEKVDGLTYLEANELATQSKFKNFVFTDNEYGVWKISNAGPVLTNAGFSKKYNFYNIHDVTTFDWFKELAKNNTVENKEFRIIRDIDLSNVTTNPITSQYTLLSNIEGNNMVISGFNIYNAGEVDRVGLFKKIGPKSIVKNLIISPESIRASGTQIVGGLAGEIDGAYIYNVAVDNQELIILGKNSVGGLAGIINGQFDIMGVSSNVSAFAVYVTNQGKQYNLYTGVHVTGTTGDNNINEVSYAGAVAGIINGHNPNIVKLDMARRNINLYQRISNITLSADLVLIAETAGGAFGLVGEGTKVENIVYNMSSSTRYQSVYIAGGLVGENRGAIMNANIYSEDETQNCFNDYALINGGIVGINIGGLVYNSTSNIDIHTTNRSATAGGIAGRNVGGTISNCRVDGFVHAEFVMGGIAGSDYGYQTAMSRTGEGTATLSTKKIYNNVSNAVTYDYYVGYENVLAGEAGYIANSLSKQFVVNFVNNQSMYYKFNTNYGLDDKNLTSATKLFGLMVGLSDGVFGGADLSYTFNTDKTATADNWGAMDLAYDSATQRFIINTKLDGRGEKVDVDNDATNNNPSKAIGFGNNKVLKLTYNNNDYVVDSSTKFHHLHLSASDMNMFDLSMPSSNDTKFTVLVLVGYESTYEYWSTSLNYSNKLVIVTNEQQSDLIAGS